MPRVMTPELRAWKLTPRLAAALGLAELVELRSGHLAFAAAALPFAQLSAFRKRGLADKGAKIDGRTVTLLTPEGVKARRHLAALEEAWPGTLERWRAIPYLQGDRA